MNSIRNQLAFQLLVGFILLLSFASSLVFVITKNILESDFDERLFAQAQTVIASITQSGNKVTVDWDNFPNEFNVQKAKGRLIHVLDDQGNNLAGNPNFLAGKSASSDRGIYRNENIQKDRIRVLTLNFRPRVDEDDLDKTPPALRKNCVLVLGSNRKPLDQTLKKLFFILVGMTGLTSIFSLLLVIFTVNRGLRPLDQLARDVSVIHVETLEKRFLIDGLPNELKPVAVKLNELLSRLELSFSRERRFSADVAHELRTPVAELRVLSEVMLRQPYLPGETRQAFRDVLDASCHMEALVQALLEIVRGESNTITLNFEKIEVCSLFQEIWKPYSVQAKEKGLNVVFKGLENFEVETDRCLFSLILNNLLSNAVDYTESGGSILVALESPENTATIIIQNSVVDVNEEDLSHFFERFWRKDKVRTQSQHLGLGLSLTHLLCCRLQIPLTLSMPQPNLICFSLKLRVFSLPS